MRSLFRRLMVICLALTLPVQAAAEVTVAERERLLGEREAEARRQAAAATEPPGLEVEDRTAPPPQEFHCFDVKNINIEGVETLEPETVSSVIEPFLNSCMGQQAVDAVLQALTQAYLDEGLITSRAYLPEQDLSAGVLTVVVVEGRVEDVVFGEIRDDQLEPAKKSRFTSAFPTEPGKILNLRDLEQGVDQMNRLPSVQAQLDISPGTEIGSSFLNVAYIEEDPIRLEFDFRHDRTASGYEQTASLGFEADNLLGLNDLLYFGLSGAESSNTISTSLSIPFGYLTFSFQANYSESLEQLTATTELFEPATSASVGASWMVYRDDRVKTRLEMTYGGSLNRRYLNGTALTPQDVRTLRFGFRNETYGEQSYSSVGAGLKFGRLINAVGGGGAPSLDFTILDYSLVRQARFDNGMSLYAYVTGQYTKNSLYSSQQLPIGGNNNIRGINGPSVSGDYGFSSVVELSVPVSFLGVDTNANSWANKLAPYVFLDAGMLRNRANGTTYVGAGIGAGTKYQIGKSSLDLFVGLPLYHSKSLTTDGPEFGFKLSAKVF